MIGLVRQETALWIIVGSSQALAKDTIRYGLSLLAVGVHAQKGYGFPIMIVVTDGEVQAESLPTQFKGADVLAASSATLGPKIVAKANMPVPNVATEYRMDIFGIQGLGQWFEVGPAPGQQWKGVMFGVAGIALSRTFDSARLYLIVGGVLYAVLFLYGLVIDHGSDANFVPVNNADNWLHLILALGMLALGLVLGRTAETAVRD